MLYNYTIKFQDGTKATNNCSMTEKETLETVGRIIAENTAKGNALLTVSVKAVTA